MPKSEVVEVVICWGAIDGGRPVRVHSFIYDSSISISVNVGVRVRRGDPDRGGWCVVHHGQQGVIPVVASEGPDGRDP